MARKSKGPHWASERAMFGPSAEPINRQPLRFSKSPFASVFPSISQLNSKVRRTARYRRRLLTSFRWRLPAQHRVGPIQDKAFIQPWLDFARGRCFRFHVLHNGIAERNAHWFGVLSLAQDTVPFAANIHEVVDRDYCISRFRIDLLVTVLLVAQHSRFKLGTLVGFDHVSQARTRLRFAT